MKKEFIHIISINTNGSCYYDEIKNQLEEFQNQVDGFIETISLFEDYVLIVNEEGTLKHLPLSCIITKNHLVKNTIVGDCFIAKINGEDFDDITEQEVYQLLNHIHAIKQRADFVLNNGTLFKIRIEIEEEV